MVSNYTEGGIPILSAKRPDEVMINIHSLRMLLSTARVVIAMGVLSDTDKYRVLLNGLGVAVQDAMDALQRHEEEGD